MRWGVLHQVEEGRAKRKNGNVKVPGGPSNNAPSRQKKKKIKWVGSWGEIFDAGLIGVKSMGG